MAIFFDSFVNFIVKIFGSHNMTMLYPNPCHDEVWEQIGINTRTHIMGSMGINMRTYTLWEQHQTINLSFCPLFTFSFYNRFT